MDNRAMGPLTDFLGMDGILRWNFCLYTEDPRKDIRYSLFGAGDINFVYPGRNGSVLLSLRYKNILRGLVDYELIQVLRAKDPETADRLVSKLFDCSKDDLKEFYQRTQSPHGIVDHLRHDSIISRNWKDYNDMKAEVLKRI